MELIVVSSEGLTESEHEAVLLLRDCLPAHWVGYAGFLMTDIQGKTMEIDILIFTEDRVLLVELKKWEGSIEMEDRTWYQTPPNGKPIKHNSPVEIKRLHAQRIKSLFNRDLFKRWGETFFEVQPMIVLCGKAKVLRTTPTDAPLVVHIDVFKNIGDKEIYKDIIPQDKASLYFERRPHLRPCNSNQISVFDDWRRGGKAIQKRYRSEASYIIPELMEPIFKGPKNVYKEHIGEHIRDAEDKALVRIWNFNNLHNVDTSMTLRSFLGLREERAIRYIRKADRQLSEDYLLDFKHDLNADALMVDMAEVYALPQMVERLDDYLNSADLNAEARLAMIRSVLTPLASMHAIGVYHRDLSAARLWWDKTRCAILISGLLSSKFPDHGNAPLAGLRHELNSTSLEMPEDLYGDTEVINQALDVFQLGALLYEVAYGTKLLCPKDACVGWVEPAPESDLFDGRLHSWFEKALQPDPRDRFEHAGQMLQVLAQQVNLQIIDTTEDKKRVLDKLTSYGTLVVPMMVFIPDPHFTPEQDIQRHLLTYYSNTAEGKRCIVRIFMAARPNPDNHGQSLRLLHFLDRCKTIGNNILPVPKIIDFGYGMNGTHVIQEYVEGISLEKWMEQKNNTYEQRYQVADEIIRAINKLHDLELSHGELTPETILVQHNDGKLNVLLLNMFELDFEGFAPKNTMYSPSSDVSSSARDRYAAYLLVDEIFGGCADIGATKIRTEIKNALGDDLQSVPRDLELLRRTMTAANEPEPITAEPITFYTQFISDECEEFKMDSGIYHFSSRRKANRLTVFICGFTHKLTINLTINGEELSDVNRSFYNKMSGQDLTTDSRLLKSNNRGQMPIEQPIRLEKIKGTTTNSKFIEYIKTLPVIRQLLKSEENIENMLTIPANESVPVKQIWRRLVEIERETLPAVTVTKDAIEKGNAVHVQIAENIDEFEFDHDDDINISTDQLETVFGQLDVKASGDGLLVLKEKNGSNQFRLKNIKEGVLLTLSNQGSDISWTRRNEALSRVLANEAVMGDLTERFISGAQGEQPPALPDITDEQLKCYDLDESKEIAFRYVLANPLSVLMGPPGTGKTTLSSAILHYLMTSGEVRRILVVSQSHVAADEVAVRTRDMITKFAGNNASNIVPSIVRLGDRERISKGMVDVHTSALQDSARTKFHSELEIRILSLSARLKLPKSYVLAAAGLYRTCGLELFNLDLARQGLIDAKLAVAGQKNDRDAIDNLNRAERRIEQLMSSLEGRLKAYSDEPEQIVIHKNPLMAALELIAETHQVQNTNRIKRMADVIKVTHHWFQRLATDQRGYAAFAARTRQLVVGTLVGIGSEAYQIHNNSFDLVIIDEAGRATFSELAIAMQSAKRIMLVGDHKQLAPNYDAAHIKEVCRTLKLSNDEVIKTDFERAFNLNNGHMLSTQYRMAPAIGEIVSQCFYDGHLKTGRQNPPDWMKSLAMPWNKTVSWIDTSGNGYLENNTSKGGVSNEEEVELLSSLLHELVSSELTIEQLKEWDKNDSTPPIGIITGYRKQVELLEHRLETSSWATGIRELIKIDTIDSYQGSENRIILLSLVRHNSDNKTGFMSDNSRVNVALSRAKERLMIIGAGAMWTQTNPEAPLARVFNFINNSTSLADSEYLIIKPEDIADITQSKKEEECNA